jgi:hypothetical protein
MNNERRIYKIHIGGRTKKWWQFWKKDPKKLTEQEISKLVESYKKEINKDFFLPAKEN